MLKLKIKKNISEFRGDLENVVNLLCGELPKLFFAVNCLR
jgi:hypothetical protein